VGLEAVVESPAGTLDHRTRVAVAALSPTQTRQAARCPQLPPPRTLRARHRKHLFDGRVRV
jgi:hypothetical protein